MVSIVTNLVSFIILCFFFYGRSLRKANVERHIKVMTAVIIADVALVLFLVFGRSALSKVSVDMSVYLIIHIFFALSTVLLYGAAVTVGLKLKKGQTQYLPQMRLIDRVLTPMRVMTLITSTALMFL